jgi:hypothetical protein
VPVEQPPRQPFCCLLHFLTHRRKYTTVPLDFERLIDAKEEVHNGLARVVHDQDILQLNLTQAAPFGQGSGITCPLRDLEFVRNLGQDAKTQEDDRAPEPPTGFARQVPTDLIGDHPNAPE